MPCSGFALSLALSRERERELVMLSLPMVVVICEIAGSFCSLPMLRILAVQTLKLGIGLGREAA